AALLVIGIPAALLQQRHAPIRGDVTAHVDIDWARVWIVAIILLAAVATNVTVNATSPELADRVPALGLAVWVALILTALWRKPEWSLLPEALKGSIFLLSLVSIASMMPVEQLPPASWQTALTLGFVSSVFDNIPLTALTI